MDTEFHYYLTYLIAYYAGFSKQMAQKIAYSSQFVDDNTNFHSSRQYHHLITASNNPFKLKYLLKNNIFFYFHFMPGEPNQQSKRCDGRQHPLATTPNSSNVRRCLQYALRSGNPYLIGIATHVFADSWAHQNFVGYFDTFNAAPNLLAQISPNLGHADYLHKPDLINLIWRDGRLQTPLINNTTRILKASEAIFIAFRSSINPACERAHIDKCNLLLNLHYCIKAKKHSQRQQRYQQLANFFGLDGIPIYRANLWMQQAKQNNWLYSDWFNFQQAAKMQHNFAKNLLHKQLWHAQRVTI